MRCGFCWKHRDDYQSEAAALTAIADKLGCSPDSLRVWVRQAQRDGGERPGLTSADKARIKELEREVRELRQANEILKKGETIFRHWSEDNGRTRILLRRSLSYDKTRLLRQKGAAAQHRKLRGSGGGGVVRSLVFRTVVEFGEPPSFLKA